MKITVKFMVLLSVVIGLFLTAIVLYIHLENQRIAEFFEEQKVYRQKNFGKIVKLIGKSIETMACDYTWWNEMVTFVETRDLQWAEVNLGSSLETFNVTDLWVYNSDYTLIYSKNNREDGILKDLPVPPGSLRQLFRSGPFCHFFVYVPAGLMEFRGAFISTDDDQERLKDPRGYFFVGRLWTEEQVREISSLTDSDVRLIFAGKEIDVKEDDDFSAIIFQEPLLGWDGSPVARLLVQSEVAGFDNFHKVTQWLLFVFVLFLGVNLILIIIFSQFWITKPLGLITKSLSSQNPASIERLAKKETEFGQIAKLIKQFYAQRNDLVREIDNRNRVEENLLYEKEFTESIIGSMPGLFYIFEKESGRFVRRNDNWILITRYNDEELKAITVPELFSEGADRDKCLDAIKKVYEDGYYVMENNILSKNGKKTPYFLTGRKISLQGKVYLAGMGIDISEQKKSEEERGKLQAQLQQAQKMESIGTMANGIAHNFNNIFGAIRGLIELAMADMPRESRMKNDLKRAIEGIEDAKGLSDKMLAFSHKYEMHYEPVRLSPVIKDAVDLFKMSVTNPIKLNVDIDPRCGLVLASASDIRQIVINLCNNAYQALEGREGDVDVRFQEVQVEVDRILKQGSLRKGKYAQLTVKDTGKGMDAQTCERIFEPFFTTKEIGKGTGLGLSVVHGIVTT
ncbi:MAG: CHASE4 domain-containing protein, partial [Candidatus Omnitrophota bacterium]